MVIYRSMAFNVAKIYQIDTYNDLPDVSILLTSFGEVEKYLH